MKPTIAGALIALFLRNDQYATAWTVPSTTVSRSSRGNTVRSLQLHMSSTSSPSNSNIVLRPSDDPSAYDSSRIGGARVHRYTRVAGSATAEEAEYVMWYHGRPANFMDKEDQAPLPSLSSGRIFRAVSKNGLVWSKCVDEPSGASLAEDVGGVSLGVNVDSWWCFDTAHVALGQVLLPMSTPAVMTEGGVYLMYYCGGTYEESNISNYLEDNDGTITPDAKLKGMDLKIGLALSQDGKAWGRIEGDDHTGACLVPNQPGEEGEEELYCAWPEVTLNTDKLKKEDLPFTMYYSTMTAHNKQKVIARAISEDGFRWFKKGVCLRPDDGSDDAAGVARCAVVRQADFKDGKWDQAFNAPWTMYYEGVSSKDNKHRIMRADSTDNGITWEKKGVVLDVGDEEADAWDCNGVGSPDILKMDDGSTRMYYTGQGKGGSSAIGAATLSSEANGNVVFTREQAEITFA